MSIEQRNKIAELERRVAALEQQTVTVKDPNADITHADIDAMLRPVIDTASMHRPILKLPQKPNG